MATLVMVDGAIFGAITADYHDRLASNADRNIDLTETVKGQIRRVTNSIRIEAKLLPNKSVHQIARELFNYPNYCAPDVSKCYFERSYTISVVGNVIDCPEASALDLFLDDCFIPAEETGVDMEDKPRFSAFTVSNAV